MPGAAVPAANPNANSFIAFILDKASIPGTTPNKLSPSSSPIGTRPAANSAIPGPAIPAANPNANNAIALISANASIPGATPNKLSPSSSPIGTKPSANILIPGPAIPAANPNANSFIAFILDNEFMPTELTINAIPFNLLSGTRPAANSAIPGPAIPAANPNAISFMAFILDNESIPIALIINATPSTLLSGTNPVANSIIPGAEILAANPNAINRMAFILDNKFIPMALSINATPSILPSGTRPAASNFIPSPALSPTYPNPSNPITLTLESSFIPIATVNKLNPSISLSIARPSANAFIPGAATNAERPNAINLILPAAVNASIPFARLARFAPFNGSNNARPSANSFIPGPATSAAIPNANNPGAPINNPIDARPAAAPNAIKPPATLSISVNPMPAKACMPSPINLRPYPTPIIPGVAINAAVPKANNPADAININGNAIARVTANAAIPAPTPTNPTNPTVARFEIASLIILNARLTPSNPGVAINAATPIAIKPTDPAIKNGVANANAIDNPVNPTAMPNKPATPIALSFSRLDDNIIKPGLAINAATPSAVNPTELTTNNGAANPSATPNIVNDAATPNKSFALMSVSDFNPHANILIGIAATNAAAPKTINPGAAIINRGVANIRAAARLDIPKAIPAICNPLISLNPLRPCANKAIPGPATSDAAPNANNPIDPIIKAGAAIDSPTPSPIRAAVIPNICIPLTFFKESNPLPNISKPEPIDCMPAPNSQRDAPITANAAAPANIATVPTPVLIIAPNPITANVKPTIATPAFAKSSQLTLVNSATAFPVIHRAAAIPANADTPNKTFGLPNAFNPSANPIKNPLTPLPNPLPISPIPLPILPIRLLPLLLLPPARSAKLSVTCVVPFLPAPPNALAFIADVIAVNAVPNKSKLLYNAIPITPIPIQAVKSMPSATPNTFNTADSPSDNLLNPQIINSSGAIISFKTVVSAFNMVAVGPNALCNRDLRFSHAVARSLLALLLAINRCTSSSLSGLIASACCVNPTIKSNDAPAPSTPACFSIFNRCFSASSSPRCAFIYSFIC